MHRSSHSNGPGQLPGRASPFRLSSPLASAPSPSPAACSGTSPPKPRVGFSCSWCCLFDRVLATPERSRAARTPPASRRAGDPHTHEITTQLPGEMLHTSPHLQPGVFAVHRPSENGPNLAAFAQPDAQRRRATFPRPCPRPAQGMRGRRGAIDSPACRSPASVGR